MSKLAESIAENPDAIAILDTVYQARLAERGDRTMLAAELAALHNAGTVDLVHVFAHLNKSPASATHDFFLTRHVFEQTLPELDAPVESVMRCVAHLYTEAGRDLAAGLILSSFQAYCQKVPARIDRALQAIEATLPGLLHLLPSVLAAGAEHNAPVYQAHCIRLTEHARLDVRQAAVFALGTIRLNNPSDAFAALELVLQSSDDDQLLGILIRSTQRLVHLDRAFLESAAVIIDRALEKGGERALHSAAQLYWLQSKELQTEVPILDVLGRHLPRVLPTNAGTIDSIDHGLAEHLKVGDGRALALLESVLLALGGRSFAQHFDSTAHLLGQDRELLFKLMTRWFLRGEPALCQAIRHVVSSQAQGEKLVLSVDPVEVVPNDPVHVVFLAHKAIGYLLMQPVAAASTVVSLMRIAPEEALSELAGLLVDPILLNYPGIAEDYLAAEAEQQAGRVQAWIKAACAELDKYLDRLRAIGRIPELHPSIEQREAHRRHFSRLMSASFKEAQAKSVFAQLVTRSVLLYGRKSISHVYGADGMPHRTEIPLTSHGVSIDIPRVEQLDPLGLDYRLRTFRQEQFR